MANYALIKLINEVETIDNVIVASQEVAETYLVANSGAYDYVINIDEVTPGPGIGWSYDPGQNEFSPPPEDFEAELEAAITAVAAAIENAIPAYIAANSGQRSTAVGNVFSNLSESASEGEMDILASLVTFLDLEAGV